MSILEAFRAEFEAAARQAFAETDWLQPLGDVLERDLDRWQQLASLVLEHNEQAGLTSVIAPRAMVSKHYVDSLSPLLLPAWANARSAVDVGSGAGFPGLVLAMAQPAVQFTMIEASAKKARFLTVACETLGIQGEVLHLRAEDFGRGQGREIFDVGLARAAAVLSVSCEYVVPLLRAGGAFIAQAGPEDGRRLAEMLDAPQSKGTPWSVLGASLAMLERADLPFGDGQRYVAMFQKHSATPARFPRGAGVASRTPLTGFPG